MTHADLLDLYRRMLLLGRFEAMAQDLWGPAGDCSAATAWLPQAFRSPRKHWSGRRSYRGSRAGRIRKTRLMPVELVMPQLRPTMTEGKVLHWYKKPGDTFETGEPLFEVERDKVNMNVEATDDGRLIEILAPLDQTAPLTAIVARYLRPGETKESAHSPGSSQGGTRAGRFAADSTLNQIKRRGPHGRIVEADVIRCVPMHRPAAPIPAAPPVPVSRIRRAIAERMAQSFRSAPHFYPRREIEAFELPGLIAREDGLLVPVLRDVAATDISTIIRRRSELTGRVRTGRLKADDFGGASATLSNPGMYGVDQFQAILNPSESLILATGRVRDRVVAVNGAPAMQPFMYRTIFVDHPSPEAAE